MAMEPPGTARTIEKSPFGVDYEVDYDIFSTLENLSDTYRAPKDRFENGLHSCWWQLCDVGSKTSPKCCELVIGFWKRNQDIWQLVILSIIMAIGIPSNIIIIFVSTYFRKSMPPSSILVTNLAISGHDAYVPMHSKLNILDCVVSYISYFEQKIIDMKDFLFLLHCPLKMDKIVNHEFRLGSLLCKSYNAGKSQNQSV